MYVFNGLNLNGTILSYVTLKSKKFGVFWSMIF